jgi:hypothetical protein
LAQVRAAQRAREAALKVLLTGAGPAAVAAAAAAVDTGAGVGSGAGLAGVLREPPYMVEPHWVPVATASRTFLPFSPLAHAHNTALTDAGAAAAAAGPLASLFSPLWALTTPPLSLLLRATGAVLDFFWVPFWLDVAAVWLRVAKKVFWFWPRFFGLVMPLRTHSLLLMQDYYDSAAAPALAARVSLSSPWAFDLPVLSAHLRFTVRLQGVRYYMHHWFLTSLFTGALAIAAVLAAGCIIFTLLVLVAIYADLKDQNHGRPLQLADFIRLRDRAAAAIGLPALSPSAAAAPRAGARASTAGTASPQSTASTGRAAGGSSAGRSASPRVTRGGRGRSRPNGAGASATPSRLHAGRSLSGSASASPAGSSVADSLSSRGSANAHANANAYANAYLDSELRERRRSPEAAAAVQHAQLTAESAAARATNVRAVASAATAATAAAVAAATERNNSGGDRFGVAPIDAAPVSGQRVQSHSAAFATPELEAVSDPDAEDPESPRSPPT